MAKKDLLDSIDVPAPCSQSWDEMNGGEKTRFCSSCEKEIYNLSEMTRSEARKLIFQSKEKVCIRLERDADGTIQTLKNRFHKITRQAPIAAGVLSASLAFSALARAQGEAVVGTTSATVSAKRQDKKTSQIFFTIYDVTGAVIADARVELTNQKSNEKFTISTNQEGVAQFNSIPRGQYAVKSFAAGFASSQLLIDVKAAVEPNVKITLNAGMIGEVITVEYEIPLFFTIVQDDNETVKRLVNSGFDVKTKNERGETALHVAVQHGNLEIVRFLLEKGAKVSVKDKQKRAPLAMIFDSFGDDDKAAAREIIRLLVSNGANIDVRNDDDGDATLLMSAAEDDDVEAVRFLLELGANPNLKDEDGETAMRKTDSDEIRRLLKRYGARE